MTIDSYETPPSLDGLPSGDAVEAMTRWFRTYFEDPVHEMPHDEGEYVYVWGGPYEARSELEHAFGGKVPDELIDRAVDELEGDCFDWAPSHHHPDQVAVRDEIEAERMHEAELAWLRENDVGHVFLEAMNELESFVDAELRDAHVGFENRMAFMQGWSILEAYLSARLIKEAESSDGVIQRLYLRVDGLRKLTFKAPDLAKEPDKPRRDAIAWLEHVSFHDIKRAMELYEHAFGFEGSKEAIEHLAEEAKRRHDCVHRNGKTKKGAAVELTRKDVRELIIHSRQLQLDIEHYLDLMPNGEE